MVDTQSCINFTEYTEPNTNHVHMYTINPRHMAYRQRVTVKLILLVLSTIHLSIHTSVRPAGKGHHTTHVNRPRI